jgi:hypothetical protein
MSGRDSRDLKRGMSNPEDPAQASKILATGKDDQIECEAEEDMKAMMRTMMSMMTKMESKIDAVTGDVAKVKHVADNAVAISTQTSEALEAVKAEVIALKESVVMKENLTELVKRVITATPTGVSGSPIASAGHHGGGKASGKGDKHIEKRRRTLYFGKFPDDSKADTIETFIKQWTQKSSEYVEEVFAFGKFVERGAARFTTEERMWEFMIENKGKLQWQVPGTTVYANPDAVHDPFPDKTKAVRKVVRLLIETHGGDGASIKKDITANYKQGKVWWKDSKFAAWDEKAGTMQVPAEHRAAFDKLME